MGGPRPEIGRLGAEMGGPLGSDMGGPRPGIHPMDQHSGPGPGPGKYTMDFNLNFLNEFLFPQIGIPQA